MKIIQKITLKLNLIFCLLAIMSSNLQSQTNYKQSESKILEIIEQTEALYSANDELINGTVYPIPNNRIDGTPYLYDDWKTTTLYINNNIYENQLTKYDLAINDIILKIEVEKDIKKLVNLNKFQVDSLNFDNSFFINSLVLTEDNNSPTYLERINNGYYSVYLKYEKVFIKEYNNITPFGKYSSTREDLFLFYNKNLHRVNKKSQFLNHFSSENQTKIKIFLKKNRIKYRKASKKELEELIKYCNVLTKS